MWIIDFLPDFIFHFVLFAGAIGVIAALFVKNIPFISQYGTLIQLISVIAIAFGVYFEGAISNEAKWQSRINELEVKLAESKVESEKENSKRAEQLAKREKDLDKRQIELTNIVKTQIVKYNSQCNIPDEFIQIINKAAERQ